MTIAHLRNYLTILNEADRRVNLTNDGPQASVSMIMKLQPFLAPGIEGKRGTLLQNIPMFSNDPNTDNQVKEQLRMAYFNARRYIVQKYSRAKLPSMWDINNVPYLIFLGRALSKSGIALTDIETYYLLIFFIQITMFDMDLDFVTGSERVELKKYSKDQFDIQKIKRVLKYANQEMGVKL